MTLALQHPRARTALVLLTITAIVVGCGSIPKFGLGGGPKMSNTDKDSYNGIASWYGGKFHGRRTANGEKYNKNGISAAHKTLPFGTVVRVTNHRNGRTLDVRINDRGPFVEGRIIDLSEGAAKKLDMIRDGVVPVSLQVLKYGSG